ncbi:hypothetical protein Tco_0796567, partial [Tanacetum coccineum]
MAFGRNTRDLGSFREETDEITDLHQILEEVLHTERGDGITSIKRRRCDPSSDDVRDLVTTSGPEVDLWKFSDIGAWVQVPRCVAWLDSDEHVDSLSTMDNEVGVTSPKSTIQTLSSFEEYTPPVTYLEEVEKTLGTPIEVEPLNETKLEEGGLNCNHNAPLSFRGFPSVDEPGPQLLPNFSPLDVNLGDKRETDPPINLYSPGSFRMK